MKKMSEIFQRARVTSGPEITFKTIDNDSNILKAQINRQGKNHTLYILAVPEESIDDFDESEFTKSRLTHHEYA